MAQQRSREPSQADSRTLRWHGTRRDRLLGQVNCLQTLLSTTTCCPIKWPKLWQRVRNRSRSQVCHTRCYIPSTQPSAKTYKFRRTTRSRKIGSYSTAKRQLKVVRFKWMRLDLAQSLPRSLAKFWRQKYLTGLRTTKFRCILLRILTLERII